VNTLYTKLAAVVLIVVISFIAGWQVQGWRKDSQIAEIHIEAQAARDDAVAKARAIEDAQAASQAFAEALAVERERKTRVVEKEVTRDVIKYVQRASSQSACGGIDSDGVFLINTAASGRMPEDADTAGQSDAGAARATAATVVASVTDNYATCHANANQLRALQDWVKTLNP